MVDLCYDGWVYESKKFIINVLGYVVFKLYWRDLKMFLCLKWYSFIGILVIFVYLLIVMEVMDWVEIVSVMIKK